jgi:hypothetical protein
MPSTYDVSRRRWRHTYDASARTPLQPSASVFLDDVADGADSVAAGVGVERRLCLRRTSALALHLE